jgi:hypothetical protein
MPADDWLIALAACLGLVTGAVARRKGYSFFVWWASGTGAFVLALPAILWMKPNATRGGKPLPLWARVAIGVLVAGMVGSFFLP